MDSSAKITTIKGEIMAFREGQIYRCPDPACGCEVTVTKGAPPDCPGTANPTCCCGKEMRTVSD